MLSAKRSRLILYYFSIRIYREQEAEYYRTIKELCPAIVKFIPEFYGVCSIEYNGSTQDYLRIQDFTKDYECPCIVDLKIGTVTWDESASEEKRQKQDKKYPLQRVLGFRFTGIRIFNNDTNKYDVYNKAYGYSLNESTISNGFQSFFRDVDPADLPLVIDSVLAQLSELLSVFRESHLRYRCSSVLITYEGSSKRQSSLSNALSPLLKYGAAVHLIDFAHVKQLAPDQLDQGCITGLERIILELGRLKESLSQ